MTEDERHAVLDECFEHNDHLRANGHVVAELALQPPETALTLYWKNGKVATTDGPYVETKEQLGGVLILEARDLNHAIQLISQLKSAYMSSHIFGQTGGSLAMTGAARAMHGISTIFTGVPPMPRRRYIASLRRRGQWLQALLVNLEHDARVAVGDLAHLVFRRRAQHLRHL